MAQSKLPAPSRASAELLYIELDTLRDLNQTHAVVTSGYGTFTASGHVDDGHYVTAGRTPNGSLVVAYLPALRTVGVDMTKLAGPVTARWFDPSNGKYASIAGSPFSNSGSRSFAPPGNNADGDGDWVLVLEAP